MDIGKLQLRGTLQSPPTGQDSVGQPAGAWTDVATGVYVQPAMLGGLERIRGGAETSAAKVSLRMRPRHGMSAGWRFVADDGTTYNFLEVPPYVSRMRYMDVSAEVIS